MHIPEGFTAASGVTRGELLHRGLAAGLAVGAVGGFPTKRAPRKSRRRGRPRTVWPTEQGSIGSASEFRGGRSLRCVVASPRRACPPWSSSPNRSRGVQLATIQALARY